MKSKYYLKFLACTATIIFIILLCINLDISNNVKNSSKLVIKANPKIYKEKTNTNGVKIILKSNSEGLQRLPVIDTNLPIILTPLSANKL